jgi:hypothetical protein
MYDSRIGRFLQEDPEQFRAGDTNLYRYVGNHPTNATDPSGLWEDRRITPEERRNIAIGLEHIVRQYELPDEYPAGIYVNRDRPGAARDEFNRMFYQDQRLSDSYPARVRFTDNRAENASRAIAQTYVAQRIVIRLRLEEAAERLRRANYLLLFRWPQVEMRFRQADDMATLLANRQFYRDNITMVLTRLRNRDALINFYINPTQVFANNDPSTDAYVEVGFGGRIEDLIHINPTYYVSNENETRASLERRQVRTMIHELGRLIPHITGNQRTPLTSTNNIHVWRDSIMILSDNYEQLTRD